MPDFDKIQDGVNSELEDWLAFNRTDAFVTPGGLEFVAPFPPPTLMLWVSGLTDARDFASHGCDIFKALSLACPTPLPAFSSILDFGVGVGRLARMFKGFRGRYAGVDVDKRHIAWVSQALDYVEAFASQPKHRLPFPDASFDCIISISVFTHMSEHDQFFYLEELARLAQPGATLLLTVHGERSLQRAEAEEKIFKMLSVPESSIPATRAAFENSGFNFIRQYRNFASSLFKYLTSDRYEYGITFISEGYMREHWSKYFDIVHFYPGAIHDFQDIVVLKARER
jgi:SAM-dependent methyltransferase